VTPKKKSNRLKLSGCRLRDRMLAAYLDDTLRDRQRRRIETHLERCADCRERLSDAARARAAAAAIRSRLERVSPDPEAFAAMMSRIRSGSAVQSATGRSQTVKPSITAGLRRYPALSAVAAAVLVAALALPLLLGDGRLQIGIDSQFKAAQPESVVTVAGGTQTEVATASTDLSPGDEKEIDTTNETEVRGPVLDTRSLQTALRDAGLESEPFSEYADGVCTLAVWLPQGQDIQSARTVLVSWVEDNATGCENASDIAIMEGETPISSDDSPDNHRLREALSLLPPMEASLSDTSGTWLILTWQVEN